MRVVIFMLAWATVFKHKKDLKKVMITLKQNCKCERCEWGRRELSKIFYKRRIQIHKEGAEAYFLKKIEKQEGGK